MPCYWLLLFTMLAGTGLLLRSVLSRLPAAAEDVLLAFWGGWLLLVILLQLWHLVLPVQPGLLLLFAVTGAAGWWRCRSIWRGWRRHRRHVVWGLLA
ncbi:MAG: hypothetical protein MUE40_07095, partial [Anaerolineae bacterium]|nr:hypothetical protein [Anaerolineae bacterium]